jgi:hypothetical protein
MKRSEFRQQLAQPGSILAEKSSQVVAWLSERVYQEYSRTCLGRPQQWTRSKVRYEHDGVVIQLVGADGAELGTYKWSLHDDSLRPFRVPAP